MGGRGCREVAATTPHIPEDAPAPLEGRRGWPFKISLPLSPVTLFLCHSSPTYPPHSPHPPHTHTLTCPKSRM